MGLRKVIRLGGACAVALFGAAVAPGGAVASSHELSPSAETSFGAVVQGSESAPIRFTLTQSTGESYPQQVRAHGNFRISATTCTGETGVGETTCTIDVVFAPKYNGTLYGRLSVSIQGLYIAAGVPLVGYGVPEPITVPKCMRPSTGKKGKGCKSKRREKRKRSSTSRLTTVSPLALDFGRVTRWQSSSTQVLTATTPRAPCLDNPEGCLPPVLLPPPLPRFTGDFSVVGNSCGGLTLDAGLEGGECKLSLVFTPTNLGLQTGSFGFPGTQFNVVLTGTGTPAGCMRFAKKEKRRKCRRAEKRAAGSGAN